MRVRFPSRETLKTAGAINAFNNWKRSKLQLKTSSQIWKEAPRHSLDRGLIARVGVRRAAGTCAPYPARVGYDGSLSGDTALLWDSGEGQRRRKGGSRRTRRGAGSLDSSHQTDRRPWQIGSLKRWAGSDEHDHTLKVQRLTLATCRGLVSLCLSSGPHQQAGSRELQRKQDLNRLLGDAGKRTRREKRAPKKTGEFFVSNFAR